MLEQEWSTRAVSFEKFQFQKKEGENDTELRGICRVQMGDFETVKPQMFRLVRGQTLLARKGMELLGGCFRFALACSAEDVLG